MFGSLVLGDTPGDGMAEPAGGAPGESEAGTHTSEPMVGHWTMTKFLIEGVGWAYTIRVVDWYSRKVVGYSIDRHCRYVHSIRKDFYQPKRRIKYHEP